jgi:hypothetical protein
MKLGLALVFCGLPAFFGASVSTACDLQRGNEVYLDARAEVAALSPKDKARVAQEWSELEAEQKSLWALAGEIDDECRRGELSPQVVPYNTRVYDWQDRLRRFLKRMRTPVESPSAKPDPQPVAGSEPAPDPGNGASEIDFPGKAPAKAHSPTPQPTSNFEPNAPKTLL